MTWIIKMSVVMKIFQILLISTFPPILASFDLDSASHAECPQSSQSQPTHRKSRTHPELYFANVAGRIPGWANISHHPHHLSCDQLELDPHYRQMDGRCNHPNNYGSTFLPVKRYLKPHYQDKYGVDSPRRFSVTGHLLPSPRLVSWKIHPDRPSSSKFSMLVMQIGQLIDHDITSAPVPTESNSTIKCCGTPRSAHSEECFAIDVPEGDPDFNSCIEFVRSDFATDKHGDKICPREQLNSLTSFVDGSAFYGNDVETMRSLRTERGKGALLKTRRVKGKQRLPRDTTSDCLAKNSATSYCMKAGDERVNEQPGLSCIHLVFHLEHNRLVRQLTKAILRKYNSTAKGQELEFFLKMQPDEVKEHLFQEARKILSGIFQKIVYCEWLPLILGPRLIRKFRLGCDKPCVYHPQVDPRIANGFLSAAFRFGHTLIPNTLLAGNQKHQLKDLFMVPDMAIQHHETVAQGLVQSHSMAFDRFFSESVSKHLFETEKGKKGALDLVSLNIQRGRDHGIPGYFHWRKYYKLRPFMRPEVQFGTFVGRQLRKLYRHLQDVDLFTGGILESPVAGGVVGETFGHIIANQFRDLKFGDAHYYSCNQLPRGFSPDQLAAIREASFARIMCSNSDMGWIQRNPFLAEGPRNPLVRCQDLPAFDISPWMVFF